MNSLKTKKEEKTTAKTDRKNALKAKILIACVILAFIGFIDATYLTILHYKNIIPPCSITHGCSTVLTSKYSTVFKIPVALMGSIYFLMTGILSALSYFNLKNKSIFYVLFMLSAAGLVISVALFSLQLFAIKTFCEYCLGSEVFSLIIFVLLEVILKKEIQTT